MRRSIDFALIFVIAALFMTPQTNAQIRSECGPNITNPLEALVGTWTFSSKTFAESRFNKGESERGNQESQPFVSAGRFRASLGATASPSRGATASPSLGVIASPSVLTITQTSNNNGKVIRQQTLTGTYEVFPDCSGGTLKFNTSSGPINFDFWFGTDTSQITAVSTTSQFVITMDGQRSNASTVEECFAIDDICGPGKEISISDEACARQFNTCINNARCFPRCGG